MKQPECQSIRDPVIPGRASVLAPPIVALLLITAVACGAITGGTAEPDLWGPFRSQSTWIVNDGSMRVELSGYERGHRPGLESEFELIVDNRLGEPVDTFVCMYLIDEEDVVQDLGHVEIDLESGTEQVHTLIAAFDEEIEPRPYGLAIVLRDWGTIVQTVRLGIPDEEAGPWLDASELPCEPEAA
jgi:hypothetical protein